MQTPTITFHLPSHRVCHVFGRGQVAQAPAEVLFGFYPGEDSAGGAPFKITFKPALSQHYEMAFTMEEQVRIERWMRGMRMNRSKIPDNQSDTIVN